MALETGVNDPKIFNCNEDNYCCGIIQIGNFRRFPQDPEKYLKDLEKELVEWIECWKEYENRALVLASLIPSQRGIKEVLLRLGFEAIVSSHRPKPNNLITVYALKLGE